MKNYCKSENKFHKIPKGLNMNNSAQSALKKENRQETRNPYGV